MEPHTLILLMMLGTYYTSSLERAFEFATRTDCHAALETMRVGRANAAEPGIAVCVPTRSVSQKACAFVVEPQECREVDFNQDGLIGSVDQAILTRYSNLLTGLFGQTCP